MGLRQFFERHVYLAIILFFGLMVAVAWAANEHIAARTKLAAAPAEDDVLAIYDLSATAGKGIEVLNFFNALEFALTDYTIHSDNLSSNLGMLDAISYSANIQSLLAAADYAAIRTLLELVISTNVQAYDADLTTYAGITPSADIQLLLAAANKAAINVFLGQVIGVDVQADLAVPSQAEAEAGTATTERVWTAERVKQAVVALTELANDTTPQLGGDLDLNGNNIDFPSTANVSDVKDEDNMVSDSATMLATQQSIKKYVDDTAGAPTNITPVDANEADTDYFVVLVGDAASSTATLTEGGLKYNPSSQTFNPSETPSMHFNDTTHDAGGAISVNSTDANDAEMLLGVDDSGGDNQTYIDIDGIDEDIKFTEEVLPAKGIGTIIELIDANDSIDADVCEAIFVQSSTISADTTSTLPAIGDCNGVAGYAKRFTFIARSGDADDFIIDVNGGTDLLRVNDSNCSAGATVTCDSGEYMDVYGMEITGTTYWFAKGTCDCTP